MSDDILLEKLFEEAIPSSERKFLKNVPAIYMLVNSVNNKIYIGRSLRLKNRMKEHFQSDFHRYNGKKLIHAKTKYGLDSFKIVVLEYCSKENLAEAENFYLNTLQPFDDRGYNIRRVASEDVGSFVMTDEQKTKISDGLKNFFKTGTPNKRKTITHNKDGTVREEYSQFRREVAIKNDCAGKMNAWVAINGSPRKRAVVMIDKDTDEIIRDFSSITEAANFLGIRGSSISGVLSGKCNTTHGYKWKYKID